MAIAKPVFAGNWKMNKGPGEAARFATEFCERVQPDADSTVILFPPAISLLATRNALADRCDIQVGAQNVHWEAEGAFTGETSVDMVVDAGATFTLVGHSERRHLFGETIAETVRKVRAVLDAGISAVLCVGESLDDRRSGRANDTVESQLSPVLAELAELPDERLLIAYEPVWAIGTGETASPADAARMHGFIRGLLSRASDAMRAQEIRILYGGSVKPDNAAQLLSQSDVDGLLVGGASLDAESFSRICESA
ncbi:MAG TPA: triose-phosphate isomerase, partial [Longimicrobiaceae bacterium]|nr:triose-phosphate isomerase [Longimicrobiaceae bacterium]